MAPLTTVARGPDTPRVKLVVAIVHNEDAGALVNALLDKEFRATRLQSSGGFLKQSNATIILGVEDADVDEVMGIVADELHVADAGRQPDAPDHGTRRVLHALPARGRGRRRDRLRPPRRTHSSDFEPRRMADWLDALAAGRTRLVAAWRGYRRGQVHQRPARGPQSRRPRQRGRDRGAARRPWPTPSRRSWRRPPEEILRARRAARRTGTSPRRSGTLRRARRPLPRGRRWQQRALPAGCADRSCPAYPARQTRSRHAPRKIAQSQRLIERSARTVAGHETEPCPLVHPLVGRLRCGEWLLFAGVHDMMHLEQLHDLAGRTQPEGPPA